MSQKRKTLILLFAIAIICAIAQARVKSNQPGNNQTTEKMKEFMLLIHLPINYSTPEATAVRGEWTTLTDKWKADDIFVASFVFPGDGYLVSDADTITNEAVISNGLKVVSSIVIRAIDTEEALSLAKKCPVLKQGGTVEVREVQPRLPVKTIAGEETKNKENIPAAEKK